MHRVTETRLLRLGALLALLAAAALLATAACDEGNEGDRCNPDLSHNDCNGGLVCSGLGTNYPIPFCPENYCCPVNVTPSDNAYCQPGCAGGAASMCTDWMASIGTPPANFSGPATCAFAGCVAEGGAPAACETAVAQGGGAPVSTGDDSGTPDATETGAAE